ELRVGSSLSQFSVPVTLPNSPRTVLIIMCLTANEAVVWLGSASSCSVAASKSAKVMVNPPGRETSGNLPQRHHRCRIVSGGAIGLQYPLGERAAGSYDVRNRVEMRGFIASGSFFPAFESGAGDADQLDGQLVGGDPAGTPGLERL